MRHPRLPVLPGAVAVLLAAACVPIGPPPGAGLTGSAGLPGMGNGAPAAQPSAFAPVYTTGGGTAGGVSSQGQIRVVVDSIVLATGQGRDVVSLLRGADGRILTEPVFWTSSNSSVATVSPNGALVSQGVGEAVVTATLQANPAVKVALAVSVVERATVTLIKVDPATPTMAVGDLLPLRAQVQMADGQVNANVSWSSSDDTVATINPTTGAVSAIREGTVTIVAAYTAEPRYKGLAQITIVKDKSKVPPSPRPSDVVFGPGASPLPVPTAPNGIQPSLAPLSPVPSPVTTGAPDSPSPATAKSFDDNPNHPLTIAKGVAPLVAGAVTASSYTIPAACDGLVAMDDGRLLVAQWGSNRIISATPVGGTSVVASVRNPWVMAIGADNTIYTASDNSGSTIRSVSGATVNDYLSVPWAEVGVTPNCMAMDADGGIYFVGSKLKNIYVSRAPRAMEVFASLSFYPAGMAFDRIGGLLVVDSTGGAIYRLTASGQTTVTKGLTLPRGLAFDGSGNLYTCAGRGAVTGGYDNYLLRIDPDGAMHRIFENPPSAAAVLLNPSTSMAFDKGGTLNILADRNKVVRIGPK